MDHEIKVNAGKRSITLIMSHEQFEGIRISSLAGNAKLEAEGPEDQFFSVILQPQAQGKLLHAIV